MKIRGMNDAALMSWMEEQADLSGAKLPELRVQHGVCNFLRTEFGGMDKQDLDKAFKMWMMGDMQNVRHRGNQFDASLIGRILGEYRRGANGIYDNSEGKGERLNRAEEHRKEVNAEKSKQFLRELKVSEDPAFKRIRKICRENRNFNYGEMILNLEAHEFGAAFGEWWNRSQENKNKILEKL